MGLLRVKTAAALIGVSAGKRLPSTTQLAIQAILSARCTLTPNLSILIDAE